MDEQIRQLESAVTKLRRDFEEHGHSGLDSKQVDLTDQIETQGSVTAKNTSTVDTTYGAQEAAVIGNNRTRIAEIVTALQSFGILE